MQQTPRTTPRLADGGTNAASPIAVGIIMCFVHCATGDRCVIVGCHHGCCIQRREKNPRPGRCHADAWRGPCHLCMRYPGQLVLLNRFDVLPALLSHNSDRVNLDVGGQESRLSLEVMRCSRIAHCYAGAARGSHDATRCAKVKLSTKRRSGGVSNNKVWRCLGTLSRAIVVSDVSCREQHRAPGACMV